MNLTSANAERLTAACVLSVVGGFLDIYTYLYRGKVFANAVTGNMVLCGFHLAHREWLASSRYVLAILFYALGIFIAEIVHRKLPAFRRVTWHQCVILLELVCLAPVCFIPYGEFDFIVNALISFVCALQVQTFRGCRDCRSLRRCVPETSAAARRRCFTAASSGSARNCIRRCTTTA